MQKNKSIFLKFSLRVLVLVRFLALDEVEKLFPLDLCLRLVYQDQPEPFHLFDGQLMLLVHDGVHVLNEEETLVEVVKVVEFA